MKGKASTDVVITATDGPKAEAAMRAKPAYRNNRVVWEDGEISSDVPSHWYLLEEENSMLTLRSVIAEEGCIRTAEVKLIHTDHPKEALAADRAKLEEMLKSKSRPARVPIGSGFGFDIKEAECHRLMSFFVDRDRLVMVVLKDEGPRRSSNNSRDCETITKSLKRL